MLPTASKPRSPFSGFLSHVQRHSVKRLVFSMLSVAMLLVSTAASNAIERAVLLKNGNLLRGQVQQLGNETVVRTGTSEMRLPTSDVQLVAKTTSDIYKYKSARSSKTARSRAELIRWCLKHDLAQEAQAELVALAAAYPEDPRVKLLHRNVANYQAKHASSKSVLPSQSPLHPDLQFATTHVGNLSSDTLRDFVRGVQPILLNRCAMAGCHGKSPQSSYHLLGHGRIPRNLSHRNLGATLRQLGGPAENSLLWMSATQKHGGMKRTLSSAETNRLGNWIARATRELGISVQSTGDVRQATAQFEADGSDPFDPAEFNSLVD